MVEMLCVKDVGLDILTFLFNAENPFTMVKEQLPRLQEVRVERRMPHQASTSSNGGVSVVRSNSIQDT